jgi:hypothetical protein
LRQRAVFAGSFFGSGSMRDTSKERAMEATFTHGYEHRVGEPAPERLNRTPEARTARGAAVFAAIWLSVAVGSPLIVRYAPSADDHAMEALATRIEQPRCAKAPEFGYPCPGRTILARESDAAKAPDL